MYSRSDVIPVWFTTILEIHRILFFWHIKMIILYATVSAVASHTAMWSQAGCGWYGAVELLARARE